MRAIAMSIAGFDPSGGAGILADIKTFEMIQTTGFGVCTSITFQRDDYIAGVNWLSVEDIIQQTEVLLEKHTVQYCKIGLVENFEVLATIVDFLHEKGIKIILDPILKASAGYDFHQQATALLPILKKVYLLTPNRMEMEKIFEIEKNPAILSEILEHTCIFLKGGHNEERLGVDHLLTSDTKETYLPQDGTYSEKHGSGCILSAAITAYLAKGHPLTEACAMAKIYTAKALMSNTSLLAYHS